MTFARIETLGRDSLNDMRSLLGVLRSDAPGDRAPRPSLAELDALIADARRAGSAVELEVEGGVRPLPGGVELAAYRALQHAVGALRGGDGERALVRLRYLPGALELEVRGRPGSGARAALMAARERIATQGGSFSAEDAAPAGSVVRARLPLVTTGA